MLPGAQWEGTMYEGGKVDLSWDNKWKKYNQEFMMTNGFSEAAIPFKTIRYKKELPNGELTFQDSIYELRKNQPGLQCQEYFLQLFSLYRNPGLG